MKTEENSQPEASAEVRTAVDRRALYEKPSLVRLELSAVVRSGHVGSGDLNTMQVTRN